MNFTVTPEDHAKIDKWLMETVYPPIVAEQRETFVTVSPFMAMDWDAGYPYQGASGGGTRGVIIGPGPIGSSWYVNFGEGRNCYVSETGIKCVPIQLAGLVLKPRRKMTLC